MSKAKVALNVSNLTPSQLSDKTRFYVQRVDANPLTFINPRPATAAITIAVDALDAAALNASDGGKTLTKVRRDQRKAVIQLLIILGAYIDEVANGDEAIIHLAGMDVKRTGVKTIAEFKVVNGTDHGSVIITVKAAQTGSVYKWQYSSDPAGTWLEAGFGKNHKKMITGLTRGINWFRVIIIDGGGEHVHAPVSFSVD